VHHCEYPREFSKKIETAWGKLIHKITRSKKSRGTVPLSTLGVEEAWQAHTEYKIKQKK
jgi:hypothetical protein